MKNNIKNIRGVLIDNHDCDPASWNNHGSIEKFKNQWYVFYHRSTNNSQKFRKSCIEPIYINKDGSINEVEMTSQGAGPVLNATTITESEQACQHIGNVRIAPLPATDIKSEGLTAIKDGDVVGYKYLNFEKNISGFEIKATSLSKLTIEIRQNSKKGTIIGTCVILPDSNYQIVTTAIKKYLKGKQALYFSFKNKNNNPENNIDWFRFY